MIKKDQINLIASLVRIIDNLGNTKGTGFFLDKYGIIITCSHVILSKEDQEKRRLELPQSILFSFVVEEVDKNKSATIRTARPLPNWFPFFKGDIILLEYKGKIFPNVKGLPLGKSTDSYNSKNEFYTLGLPERAGLKVVPSTGKIFPGIHPSMYEFGIKLLLDEAGNIIPGYSGAPVINTFTGNIIGVISWIASPYEELGKFRKNVAVIPSELIIKLIPQGYNLRPADLSLAPKTIVLSKFPRIVESEIFGRESELIKLEKNLIESNAPINISGIGGIGKTSFLQLFLSRSFNKKAFTCILWVDYLNSIPDSFLNDKGLLANLSLEHLLQELKDKSLSKQKIFLKYVKSSENSMAKIY